MAPSVIALNSTCRTATQRALLIHLYPSATNLQRRCMQGSLLHKAGGLAIGYLYYHPHALVQWVGNQHTLQYTMTLSCSVLPASGLMQHLYTESLTLPRRVPDSTPRVPGVQGPRTLLPGALPRHLQEVDDLDSPRGLLVVAPLAAGRPGPCGLARGRRARRRRRGRGQPARGVVRAVRRLPAAAAARRAAPARVLPPVVRHLLDFITSLRMFIRGICRAHVHCHCSNPALDVYWGCSRFGA